MAAEIQGDGEIAHNKALQSDQFMLSRLLLEQKPRQHSLAAEERRYAASSKQE